MLKIEQINYLGVTYSDYYDNRTSFTAFVGVDRTPPTQESRAYHLPQQPVLIHFPNKTPSSRSMLPQSHSKLMTILFLPHTHKTKENKTKGIRDPKKLAIK